MLIIVRLLTTTAALALIVGGLIVFPMPIPLGAAMIVIGLVLLISVSATVALRLKLFRSQNRWLNDIIQKVEDRLPERLKKVLRRTDP